MPLKQYDTLSVDERSLPREITLGDVQEVWNIECTDKWCDQQPLPIAENGEVTITWDMSIYTDTVLKHNWPDITLVH